MSNVLNIFFKYLDTITPQYSHFIFSRHSFKWSSKSLKIFIFPQISHWTRRKGHDITCLSMDGLFCLNLHPLRWFGQPKIRCKQTYLCSKPWYLFIVKPQPMFWQIISAIKQSSIWRILSSLKIIFVHELHWISTLPHDSAWSCKSFLCK